jgi:hypothetical protein
MNEVNPLVTQQALDLAILAVLGAVALGVCLAGIEWLILRRRDKHHVSAAEHNAFKPGAFMTRRRDDLQ